MVEVVWSQPALADLDAVADYIALDNPTAAKQLVRDIFERIDKLVKHPRLGPKLPELPGSGYRQLIVPPCRIVYRQLKSKIYIVCLFRSERRFDTKLVTRAHPI